MCVLSCFCGGEVVLVEQVGCVFALHSMELEGELLQETVYLPEC